MCNTPSVWINPLDCCNVCGIPFGDGEGESRIMYDARLRLPAGIIWGNICDPCFQRYGGELGTGKGQRYELQMQHHSTAAIYPVSKMWFKTGG